MIFREAAPVVPLLVFASTTMLGLDPTEALVPFLLCEAGGVWLYVAEIRYRFRYRNGRR